MDESARSKTTSKANLKVNAPTKKASKVKVEPIQDQSDPEEFNHVTSVNGKNKRQRKKKSNVYNGKEALSPSERFYRDQIKAINNNPTQNGCNNFDAKIDDVWNKVTQVSRFISRVRRMKIQSHLVDLRRSSAERDGPRRPGRRPAEA